MKPQKENCKKDNILKNVRVEGKCYGVRVKRQGLRVRVKGQG